jgi:hypothetical protein
MSKKSRSRREKRRKKMFEELRKLGIERYLLYSKEQSTYINRLLTSPFGPCFALLSMNGKHQWTVSLPCGKPLIQTSHTKDAIGIIRTLKLVTPE